MPISSSAGCCPVWVWEVQCTSTNCKSEHETSRPSGCRLQDETGRPATSKWKAPRARQLNQHGSSPAASNSRFRTRRPRCAAVTPAPAPVAPWPPHMTTQTYINSTCATRSSAPGHQPTNPLPVLGTETAADAHCHGFCPHVPPLPQLELGLWRPRGCATPAGWWGLGRQQEDFDVRKTLTMGRRGEGAELICPRSPWGDLLVWKKSRSYYRVAEIVCLVSCLMYVVDCSGS